MGVHTTYPYRRFDHLWVVALRPADYGGDQLRSASLLGGEGQPLAWFVRLVRDVEHAPTTR